MAREEGRSPCASPDGTTWKPLALEWRLVLRGGYQSKSHVLETTTIEVDDREEVFVRIDKNAEWLLKAAAGKLAVKGALKRVTLLDKLKVALVARGAAVAAPSAVADTPKKGDSADPMDALDDVEEFTSPIKKARKECYASKRASGRVVTIDMPDSPVGGGARQVRLMAKSTNQTWLAREDLQWFVESVAAEVCCGGVPLAEDDANSAVAEPNCTVPGLHLQWDFGRNGNRHYDPRWTATFVTGPLQGQQFTSRVQALTAAKWQAVARLGENVGESFEAACAEERKSATRLHLVNHCRGLLGEGSSH